MLETYRYRVYPDKNQIHELEQDFGSVRFVSNKALEFRSKAYRRRESKQIMAEGNIQSMFSCCFTEP